MTLVSPEAPVQIAQPTAPTLPAASVAAAPTDRPARGWRITFYKSALWPLAAGATAAFAVDGLSGAVSLLVLIGGLVLLIGVPVAVHEAAHAVVMRRNGLEFQSFNVGFGAKIVTVTTLRAEYSLKLLPLGGYVSAKTLAELPAAVRVRIAAAGPASNLVLAAVAALVLCLIPMTASTWTVTGSEPNTAAAVLSDKDVAKAAGLPEMAGQLRATPDGTDLQITGADRSLTYVHSVRPVGTSERIAMVTDRLLSFVTPGKADPVHVGKPATVLVLFVSINAMMALFNMLPLSPFDGGHIALAGYERAKRSLTWLPSTKSYLTVSLLLGLTALIAVNVIPLL